MCLLSPPYVWTRNTVFLISCYQAQPVCLVVKMNRYYSDYRIYLSFPIIRVVFLLPTGPQFSSVFCVLVQMRSTAVWLKGLFWKALRYCAALAAQQELNCQQRGRVRETLWFDPTSTQVRGSILITESIKSRENLALELFL